MPGSTSRSQRGAAHGPSELAAALVSFARFQSRSTHDALLAISHAAPKCALVVTSEGVTSQEADDATDSASPGMGAGAGAGAGASGAESATAAARDVPTARLKASVARIVRGFVRDGDAAEALRQLRELRAPYYLHEFVKRVAVVAMDNGDAAVALASELLDRAVAVGVLLIEVLRKGMARLLAATDDLQLDVPDAARYVAIFVSDAIKSGSLPADFFDTLEPQAAAAVASGGAAAKAKSLVEDKRRATQRELKSPTGAGPFGPVSDLKHTVYAIADDYLRDGLADVAEAQVLRMQCPHYMHELVLRLFVLALERGTRETCLASALVDRLHRHGLLEASVAKQGFVRLMQRCDDLSLDVPRASAFVAEAVAQAVSDGVLPASFFADLPDDVKSGFKADGAAVFAQRLYDLYGAEPASRNELSSPRRP